MRLLSEISPDNRRFDSCREAQLARELHTPEPRLHPFDMRT